VRTRPLGQSGIQASVIGMGTWAIGPWAGEDHNEADGIEAVKTALDLGINLFDTAPLYGLGRSEEVLGKAIAGRREQAVIATKCGLVWHTDNGPYHATDGGTTVYRNLGTESIRHEVEQSLRRLNTDYIDLLQPHWPDEETPIGETMSAMLALKEEGKIRAIGASNVTVDQLIEYRRVGQLDTDQEPYSMLDRGIESGLLPWCLEHRVSMLAYSPLARGLLTGRMGPEVRFTDGREQIPRWTVENRRRIVDMLETCRRIGEEHGASSGQVVIAWTIEQPGLTHALMGARNPEQARQNVPVKDLLLSDEELVQIDASYRKLGGHIV
jgi:methylglyoxal reductase